jgi:hypothetical protein
MKLNINSDWLLRMAEEEDNTIVSVGGLVTMPIPPYSGTSTSAARFQGGRKKDPRRVMGILFH